ncbi:RRS1-domain-containing protein [Lepidopterella palustris CBS 459.81]|uniref:Ribosome biogenesis regulatory protein n=1 Tax=Lepidopterella palustris CBS 459.81 TaxID=1314670 RepID=A0A8E2JI19_9PEZI|nr:RRS1-domain-containing protein [Lepidopterella palustris CBS 459.81]
MSDHPQSPQNLTQLAEIIDSGAMDVSTPASTIDRLCVPEASPHPLPSNMYCRPVTVIRPTPYTFDLGNLLANDPNPLPTNPDEATLQATARDAAQALVNQLLTTCEIKSTSDGVLLYLPAPTTPLPREKPIPIEKPPTKWEQFAARKGIKDKARGGKMVYDEPSGEWVPKWGYKGKNKELDTQWLVEVDEKKERETGVPGDARADGRRERKERIRRNERRQRANERNARKNG